MSLQSRSKWANTPSMVTMVIDSHQTRPNTNSRTRSMSAANYPDILDLLEALVTWKEVLLDNSKHLLYGALSREHLILL